MKTLIVMRGCPGSGKSHTMSKLIYSILKDNPYATYTSCSTDDFWGHDYKFTPSWLGIAHEWNFAKFTHAVFLNTPYIFIDNTNIKYAHFEKYIEFAVKNGYVFTMVEADTPWKYNAKECHKKNTHGVPLSAIERMISNFDTDLYVLDSIPLDLRERYVRSSEIFTEA